jgi:multiple sugar transport system substrate-binding protein
MADDGHKVAEIKVAEKHDPVLIVISRPMGFIDEGFEQSIQQQVSKRYPYITLNWITESGNEIENQVVSGATADIYFVNPARIEIIKSLNLEYSMDHLIKQFGFDLGQLEPGGLNMVQAAFGTKSLNALPYALGFAALFYNKDLFDRFGVKYPQDGMTWEDAMQLAKSMARSDGGVQYHGLGFARSNILQSQLSLPFVDGSSGRSMLNAEGWHKAFATLKGLYDSSGTDVKEFDNGLNAFSKDKTLAMLVTNNLITQFDQNKTLNWDLVTLPSFKDSPKTTAQPVGVSAAIAAVSKHKEEAFQVISVILSKPVQSVMIQSSNRPPVLMDEQLRQQFSSLSGARGKNLGSVFKHTPAKSVATTEYDTIVQQAANQALTKLLQGSEDINSALREAEEQANQKIAAAKAGK